MSPSLITTPNLSAILCRKRLKQIDKYNKYLVFGHTREMEQSLDLSNTIPLLIQYAILLFYYHTEQIEFARSDCFKYR